MARLKVKYTEEVAPALFKKFGYKSTMQIPKIDKVVVNVGCGEARENPKVLEAVCKDLGEITGQKAIVTIAKKSVANFKLREGMIIGAKVTLRGERMYEFVDKLFNHPDESQEITEKKALAIGFFQCIAMIPGVSRSMATIVGGMAQRLSRKTAAEFSFFLAVPTMFAATAYKVLKLFLAPNGMEVLSENITALVVGNVVAFIVALLAIKFFIGFVTRYGFKAFGYYRIVVGGLILVMLFLGYNLQIV